MAESKYATKLFELGFVRVEGLVINREMRRRLAKDPTLKPTFSRVGGDVVPITFATDETHRSWMKEGHIDLSFLGFLETTRSVEKAQRALLPKDPKSN